MLGENYEEAYEEEVATMSHFSNKRKQKIAMTPMIAKAVTPPEFPNKEELETDFASMTEEDGSKEEIVAR